MFVLPPFHSPCLVPTLPPCLLLFLLCSSSLALSHQPLLNLSVGDSQERGEERRQHVRSPEIPLRSGEQRGVFLRGPCGVESRPQRPVPVSHLPRWPGHPGLSWSGAQQSW